MKTEKTIYPITHVRNRDFKAFEESFDYHAQHHKSSLRNSLVDAVINNQVEFLKIAYNKGFDLSFRNGILISNAWYKGYVDVIDYLIDDLNVAVNLDQILHIALHVDNKYFNKLIVTVKLDDEKWEKVIRICGFDHEEEKNRYPLLCNILSKYPDSHKHFIKQYDLISFMLAHKQYDMFEMYIKLGGKVGNGCETGSISKTILSIDYYTDEQYFEMGGTIPKDEWSDSDALKKRIRGLSDKWLSWKTKMIRKKQEAEYDSKLMDLIF